MKKVELILLCALLLLCVFLAKAQNGLPAENFRVTVVNEQNDPLEGAVVELLQKADQKLIRSAVTNKNGLSFFYIAVTADQVLRVSYVGHETTLFPISAEQAVAKKLTLVLPAAAKTLGNVSVSSRKAFIQRAQGKTIVNVDASVTNAGTTVLEVLEKSPGVMVDRNGGISLQGKAGVLVLIDDKPTYVSGSDLNNLLSGISSSQVDQIELITSPSARYDASGNAGIINIKTKKNRQTGFNGTLTGSLAQGRYPKNNNSLVLNYRNGKFNAFATWSSNFSKGFMDIYALRKYFNTNGTLLSLLDQPTGFLNQNNSNTLKMGLDFYASQKTTFGITLTGIANNRSGSSDASANWKNAAGVTDSTIRTFGATRGRFRNGGINLNAKHTLSRTQEITADLDYLSYDINNQQSFSSLLQASGGYTEGSRGSLPATISIRSAKLDHTLQIGKNAKLESGYKLSAIRTDNLAAYELYDGSSWKDDINKSNHFLYQENIHALYSSFEHKTTRVSYQLGLRYENTHYDAHQLGNARQKDSAFSRTYSGLFPSGYISIQADSSNSFTFTAGRRIDRPPFQKLNPYVSIINKYTYEKGNPFFQPQYSWNLELSYQYKQWLTTTVSYSIIKDYFSQLFLNDGSDILVYTNGNVGRMTNLGISVAVQLSPFPWWSFSGQVLYNHKELKGYRNVDYRSDISQTNLSINNQFKAGQLYTLELSGFYTGRARNDLQELLYPTGQLSIGVARPVFNKKGTLRLSVRDLFFTQAMEGLTNFPGAEEYFLLKRDTRVVNLGLSYRFGKPLKTTRRNQGSAKDEMDRVGAGG